jgi:(E)-4-hydroxy-3-methylbut-2-enyl-diphosphate synthase
MIPSSVALPRSFYVADRFGYARRVSRAVMVGRVQVGGLTAGKPAPLVLQSMCTTPTQDVAATVQQSILLAESGCQVVRITAPGVKDAQALKDIRAQFSAAGFRDVPLVADIHFMPAAAMEAIEHVEKVRVNPGNFADKKRFAVLEYSDAEYQAELERVAERFLPLVRRAKTLGRALRIGTNHGSLSDRIMNRWGDTPRGMVESAMEFVRIAESEGFKDLIISMKSSNPKVMVEAYRLLCATLADHGEAYPLHLGVTEAGDGEDGRTKSAAGIGALLEDGIGDTIRVSLTEPPECEIPVAAALAARYARLKPFAAPIQAPRDETDPYTYRRRVAEIVRIGDDIPVGGGLLPRVFVPRATPKPIGKEPDADVRIDDHLLWAVQAHSIPGAEGCQKKAASFEPRVASSSQLAARSSQLAALVHLKAGCDLPMVPAGALVLLRLGDQDPVAALRTTLPKLPDGIVLGIAEPGLIGEVRAYRLLAAVIEEQFRAAEAAKTGSGRRQPIAIALPFQRDELAIAAIAGSLLIDGIGDALYLPQAPDPRRLAFTVLQAVKARVTRADYVACPSCGRTLFNLIDVTAHIKEVTNHLDGVTIAIMGCIVNGPGEMADADFGYVGAGPGKIDLYRGKEKVRTGIPSDQARAGLIQLIKDAGKWKEPG